MEEYQEKRHKAWQVEKILSKIVGGEDIEWAEMASLEGFGMSPDQLRRMGQGIKLAYEAGMIREPEEMDETEYARVRKEKQKMWDLRREVNEVYRATARDELLRESIMEAADKLPPIEIPEFEIRAKSNPDASLVVTLADAHYGREVEIRGLRGEVLNAYSPEIFESRMECLLGQVVNLANETNVSEIVIANLGDSIDGMLRASQLMTLRYGMVDSTMYYAEYIAQWLSKLSKHFPVRFVSVAGNHDSIRALNAKKASDFPRENFSRIIAWFVAERLRDNPRVTIIQGGEVELVDICGFNALFIHGDYEKKSNEAAQEYGFLYNTPIDFVFRGHYHFFSDTTVGVNRDGHNIYEIQAPSLCGIDDYAITLKSRASAGAVGVLIERGRGKVAVFMLPTP